MEINNLCAEYNNRCEKFFREIGGISLGSQTDLMESLEEKARTEYEGFIQLFVDPKGDITKRHNLLEKGITKASSVLPRRLRRTIDSKIEGRVIDRCIEDYLSRMEEEVNSLEDKAMNASKTYDRSLELVTILRIDYIDQLSLADQCDEGKVEGEILLEATRGEVDKLLDEKKIPEAREIQKSYIRTEKTTRIAEKERDKHSSNALGVFNQLTLMFSVYERARVYSQFLGKNAAILGQTYEHLRMRWQDYQTSGNVGDVLEFLKWNEEIKGAKEIFDRNFSESLPLIRKVDGRIVEEVSQDPKKNDTSLEVYAQAKSLRSKVMGLSLG